MSGQSHAGAAKECVNTSLFDSIRVETSDQRDFHQYLASTFLATIAMMIQSVAVAWQVYDLVRAPWRSAMSACFSSCRSRSSHFLPERWPTA